MNKGAIIAILGILTFNTSTLNISAYEISEKNNIIISKNNYIGSNISDFLTSTEIDELIKSQSDTVTLKKLNVSITENTTLIIPSEFNINSKIFNVEVDFNELFSSLTFLSKPLITELKIGLDNSDKSVKAVGNLNGAFNYFINLKTLDLTKLDTSTITDMSSMFSCCFSLQNINLSNIDTSNVTDMSYMFMGCNSLTNLDLSSFNTSKVTNMQGMFEACSSLKNITVSSFNTSNVTTMSYMFMGCSSLSSLNLSNFNTSKVTYANSMFENCNNLLNYTKPVGVLLSTSESSVSNTEITLTDISNSTEKDKILEFFNNGYISGYLESDGTYSFKPENPMTRAEFVKLANRVFGFVRRGSHSFTDVSSSDWFYNDVLIAMNEGYITGYSDNAFRPNEPITREEIAVIISRIKNLRATKIVNFKDLNEVGNYAKDAVMAVYNYGIVSGYSDNTFRPKENAKRQHVVKMLYNASKITLKDSN